VGGRPAAGANAGSRRVTALVDGDPTPGHAVFRTRFGGIEVDSGGGVF
jgi:release factor glutamine methyltransferase